jgi:hypothetical protein
MFAFYGVIGGDVTNNAGYISAKHKGVVVVRYDNDTRDR